MTPWSILFDSSRCGRGGGDGLGFLRRGFALAFLSGDLHAVQRAAVRAPLLVQVQVRIRYALDLVEAVEQRGAAALCVGLGPRDDALAEGLVAEALARQGERAVGRARRRLGRAW